ncbi:MAG TPA: hypothetical protein VN634_08510 [Candidatus Limnocylindrales bacterium]|nr:hypothetical protein [Candidatus Limnocylindrales bacterium]
MSSARFGSSLARRGLLSLALLVLAAGCGDGNRSYDSSPADDTNAPVYTVTVAVTSDANLGALQLEVRHRGDSGGFVADGDRARCQAEVTAIMAANVLGHGSLKVGLVSLAGFRTPATIVHCSFRTYEVISTQSFDVDVTDASDPNGDAVRPVPTAVVSSVVSGDDHDPDYDDSCDPSWRAYTLEISVNQSSAPRIGALQLEVTHLGDSGCFIGRGDQIDCVALVDALVAANYPGERTAKIGMISLDGIPTPAAVIRCGFRTSESLSPASFLVEVMDASTTGGDPIDPPPSVGITVTGR